MLYNSALSEHKRLAREADSIRRQLDSLPEGKLICTSGNGYIKWYQSDGHTPVYIPKKNRALAEQLALKKYLTLRLESIRHELRAVDAYLMQHDTNPDRKYLDLLSSPGYSELLSPSSSSLSEELTAWATSPIESNAPYPEALIHPAPNGLFVRSKSEVLIALQLHTHGIPFRYEAPLQLGESTYYPDFTIRHPATGEYYYWEHFGLMDDSKYIQKATTKLHQYLTNGIIPTIQLITTYETRMHPLTTDVIVENIKRYIL